MVRDRQQKPPSEPTLSESDLEQVLRQTPALFWVSDFLGNRIIFQSNRSIEIHGDLQGREFASLDLPHEAIAKLQDHIHSALTGKSVAYETTLPLSTTQDRTYHTKISPIYDEAQKTIGVLGVCHDITEQEEKNRLLIARRRLAEQLNNTTHCEEAFKLCFETTLLVSRVRKASVCSVDEEGNATLLLHNGTLPETLQKSSTLKLSQVAIDAAARGEPLVRTPDEFAPEFASFFREHNITQISQYPMCQNGQMIALLAVATNYDKKFPQWCLDELRTIASQTEATITRIKTQESLEADRRLLRQVLSIQERERQLISSEIHDGFVQDVVGAQMMLEAVLLSCSDPEPVCREFFGRAKGMIGRAIQEARRFISDLRPLVLEESGVVEAVNFHMNRPEFSSRIKIRFTHDEVIERFNPLLEEIAFRIIQEGITNAVLHSKGTKIEVDLTENKGLLSIHVIDDGIGFDPLEAVEHGFGIRGIIERASLFGGTAKIESKPGQGTKVLVELPISRLSDTTP